MISPASPAQKVMNDIAKRHPPGIGYDFDFSKQSAAEALDYGDDLRALEQQCLTAEEFFDFLERMGLESSMGMLLMELSRRLNFMGKQICELCCIQPLQLVELLALDDYEIRRLAAGMEVKGMTLAMVSVLRPMTIRNLVAP